MVEKSSVGAKGWVTAALAGVVAGLVAAHSLPSSDTTGGRVTAARPAVATVVPVVDRSRKGDRLDAASPAPGPHAIGRLELRKLLERALSRQLQDTCEPPASPFVDPQLAKLPGRCLT
jgi:hypothetical protein